MEAIVYLIQLLLSAAVVVGRITVLGNPVGLAAVVAPTG
jgi:hypothetical protein